MKQVSFLVEVVVQDKVPTIILRDPRGFIIKVTSEPSDVKSFLCETIKNLSADIAADQAHE